jgi:hypothetical protein
MGNNPWKTRRRREDNIKIEDVGYEVQGWINLAQDRAGLLRE